MTWKLTPRRCIGCGVEFLGRRSAKWCTERCRKAQYAGTCVDCGAATNGSNGRGNNAPERCARCDRAINGERHRERLRPHRELVERLWAEGKTCREIGEIMGWASKASVHISTLRARGYDLPYRRTPEQVARIAAGTAHGLGR